MSNDYLIEKFNVRFGGKWQEMSLVEAIELDKPEGVALIECSATLVKQWLDRIAELENISISQVGLIRIQKSESQASRDYRNGLTFEEVVTGTTVVSSTRPACPSCEIHALIGEIKDNKTTCLQCNANVEFYYEQEGELNLQKARIVK